MVTGDQGPWQVQYGASIAHLPDPLESLAANAVDVQLFGRVERE
jgi:hypothetical protein